LLFSHDRFLKTNKKKKKKKKRKNPKSLVCRCSSYGAIYFRNANHIARIDVYEIQNQGNVMQLQKATTMTDASFAHTLKNADDDNNNDDDDDDATGVDAATARSGERAGLVHGRASTRTLRTVSLSNSLRCSDLRLCVRISQTFTTLIR
jgi:acetyl-CoA carboxylase beta subunit